MMSKQSTTKPLAVFLAGVALVVLLAGTAHARTFSVTTVGSKLTWQTAQTVLPILGNYYSSLAWRPVTGTPMYVNATGSNPASLTLQPGLFNQPGYFFATLVPSLTDYIQFSTGLGVYAPQAAAVFKPGPKTSRPANFNWCPGATANPACTTVYSGGSQGTRDGIVKYTAGAPQFGGTMKVFTTGQFTWWTIVKTAPTYLVRYNNATDTTGTIPAGGGYDIIFSYTAGLGDPVYANPGISTGGFVTNPGTFVYNLPGVSATAHGFPFTTGHVYVKVPFAPPASPFQTISKSGSDSRTPLGLGNITMVAGGLNLSQGVSTPHIVTMTLNVPEPSRFLMLASGLGLFGLLVLGRRALARQGAQAA